MVVIHVEILTKTHNKNSDALPKKQIKTDNARTTTIMISTICRNSICGFLSAKAAKAGCVNTDMMLTIAKATPITELEKPLSNKNTEAYPINAQKAPKYNI